MPGGDYSSAAQGAGLWKFLFGLDLVMGFTKYLRPVGCKCWETFSLIIVTFPKWEGLAPIQGFDDTVGFSYEKPRGSDIPNLGRGFKA